MTAPSIIILSVGVVIAIAMIVSTVVDVVSARRRQERYCRARKAQIDLIDRTLRGNPRDGSNGP